MSASVASGGRLVSKLWSLVPAPGYTAGAAHWHKMSLGIGRRSGSARFNKILDPGTGVEEVVTCLPNSSREGGCWRSIGCSVWRFNSVRSVRYLSYSFMSLAGAETTPWTYLQARSATVRKRCLGNRATEPSTLSR